MSDTRFVFSNGKTDSINSEEGIDKFLEISMSVLMFILFISCVLEFLFLVNKYTINNIKIIRPKDTLNGLAFIYDVIL